MTGTSWNHQVALPTEGVSAREARRFVQSRLIEHGLDDLVDDVQLAASELATNAVVHARTPFTVCLCEEEASVLLSVRDGSGGSPAPVDAPPTGLGGRGLAIVAQISSQWGVRREPDGSTAVWAVFPTQRRGGAASPGCDISGPAGSY